MIPNNNAQGLLFAMLVFAALLLSILAAGDGTWSLDVTITEAIQRIDSGLVGDTAKALNRLGETAPAVAIGGLAVLVLAHRRRLFEASVILAAVVAKSFSPMLKELLESPRPDGSAVRVAEVFGSYGFPSGHAMGAMLFYGSLIYVIERLGPFRGRRAIQAVAVLMIVGTGFSRVYVGAHWPTDVLGGYLWGATFLFAAVVICERIWAPRSDEEAVVDIGTVLKSKS